MKMKPYRLSVHIFRRDLRLEDNTALNDALHKSGTVLPCFIFDPRQVKNNSYRGDHALQFMLESLESLDDALKQKGARLHYFWGEAEDVLQRICRKLPVEAVFTNRDYTPFSRKRDEACAKACRESGVDWFNLPDALLHEPEHVQKKTGGPYSVYTPFMREVIGRPVAKPRACADGDFFHEEVDVPSVSFDDILKERSEKLFCRGGRAEAVKRFRRAARLDGYDEKRDIPSEDGTTGLSAHLKFGTCSVREVFHTVLKAFGPDHALIRQLIWRDFFTHIAFHFPRVFRGAFHEKYNAIRWSRSERLFDAWREGRTGFPIVDAGMRQLNTTGTMHNRVRMVTASFLVKDLLIDWRRGEKYFARKLLDYDPCVNNGSWQWAASTGCDAQPYFRIFNPWRQQERFDPEGRYIKFWVPELRDVPPDVLHKLHRPGLSPEGYPEPVVDHAAMREKVKAIYQSC